MSLYLVRLTDNQEAVGLVYAESKYDLANCVDELVDPSACEYKRLPSGSAVFFASGCDSIPAKAEDGPEALPIGKMSEALVEIMTNDDKRPWKPLSNQILYGAPVGK